MAPLTPARRRPLRLPTLAAALLVSLSVGPPGPTFAQTPMPSATGAAAAAPETLKLFSDSRMITRDRISVEVAGSGPDIVMIPGLASTRETWRRTAERLRGRYRVHLVNVAGFGGETARANASGPVFEPVAADIDGYLAMLGRPIVMGHSLGGTLGVYIAERHPEHMSRLLVVDALPFFGMLMGGPSATPDSVRPMVEQMSKPGAGGSQAGMPAGGQRKMIENMVTAPADVDRVLGWGRLSDPRVVMRAMTEDFLTDLRPGFASLTTPVTVLYPFDPTLGYPEAVVTANYVNGYAPAKTVAVVRVEKSRHFIMYDQPARFDQEVDAFLNRPLSPAK